MNKLRYAFALVLLLLSSAFAWAGLVHAQAFLPDTNASQTVNSSLYSFGQNIDIEGTVNGDVYCAGRNVTIDATVHGDVLCAGQTVTVSGRIDGSLRVVAETVTDQAHIGKSFSVATHSAVITKGATIGVDASFVGQTFTVNGRVARDIAARASSMNVNGTIGRNIKYSGTNLNVWSRARIQGNLDYNSQSSAIISKSAVIHGAVSHSVPTPKLRSTRAALGSWAGSFLYFFAAMLLFGLVLVLLMPQVVRAVSDEASNHLGRTLLNALVMLILEPIILIVLFGTFIGVPLAIICLLLFILLGIFSLPVTAYYIGVHVMSRSSHAVLTMGVGMFILMLLLMLPIIGFFAAIASYFIGSGAIVLALRKYVPTPVYKVK